VRAWGIFLAFLSSGFIAGGLMVAKFGLGKSPIKTLFNMGMITWAVCIFFTSLGSIPVFIGGIFIWMALAPVIEAAESTILQKVIPVERQGRVIGVAQTLEQLASPITAFLIGPLTHFFFIPFMTTGWGAAYLGPWFGTGEVRAMALVFTVAGFIGLLVSLFAKYSKSASDLDTRYQQESAK
jgi:DHA3 family multidrug efflux protein-like MFS transporter